MSRPDRSPVPLTVIAGTQGAMSAALASAPSDTAIAIAAPATLLPEDAPAEALVTDVAERTPGCPCCRSRLDVIDAVERLVRRRLRPDRVFVGVDVGTIDDDQGGDVATVVHSVLSDPDLQRLVRLDGVAVVVDAPQLSTRLRAGLPFASPAALDALAMADEVLFTNVDHVTSDSGRAVARATRAVSLLAHFTTDRPDGLPPLRLRNAWETAPRHAQQLSHAADHHPSGSAVAGPRTVILEQDGPLDPDAVEEWLDETLAGNARRLLRLQGSFRIAGERSRWRCHAVRSYAQSCTEVAGAGPGNDSSSVVAIVGRDLDAAELSDGFRGTLAMAAE